ncbi:hypothetical protein Pelo_2714 [Pelomyxa schiedti]|nr:hypothetical protein Pelo_2714 [Pelomyxa schiedti]
MATTQGQPQTGKIKTRGLVLTREDARSVVPPPSMPVLAASPAVASQSATYASNDKRDFFFVIDNFVKRAGSTESANIEWKFRSNIWTYDCVKWRCKIVLANPSAHRQATQASVYLQIKNGGDFVPPWTLDASLTVELVNHLNFRKSIVKECHHVFNQDEWILNWGFSDFVSISHLFDPERGFLDGSGSIVWKIHHVEQILSPPHVISVKLFTEEDMYINNAGPDIVLYPGKIPAFSMVNNFSGRDLQVRVAEHLAIQPHLMQLWMFSDTEPANQRRQEPQESKRGPERPTILVSETTQNYRIGSKYLHLFVEISDLPMSCPTDTIAFPETDSFIKLYFKFFNVSQNKLLYVGSLYCYPTQSLAQIVPTLRLLASLDSKEELQLFKESPSFQVDQLPTSTPLSSLSSGDVVVFQPSRTKMACSNWYTRASQCVVVVFYLAEYYTTCQQVGHPAATPTTTTTSTSSSSTTAASSGFLESREGLKLVLTLKTAKTFTYVVEKLCRRLRGVVIDPTTVSIRCIPFGLPIARSQGVQDILKLLEQNVLFFDVQNTSISDFVEAYNNQSQVPYFALGGADMDLICNVCRKYLTDPVLHSTCGEMLCAECAAVGKCPGCSGTISPRTISPAVPTVIRNRLLSANVVCTVCCKVTQKKNSASHLQSCKCVCADCGMKYRPQYFKEHTSICVAQMTKCGICGVSAKRGHIVTTHLLICPCSCVHGCGKIVCTLTQPSHDKQCPAKQIKCPKCGLVAQRSVIQDPSHCAPCPRQCGVQVAQGCSEAHDAQCGGVTVPCPASDAMCPWRGPRSGLSQHIGSCAFMLCRSALVRMLQENATSTARLNSLVQSTRQRAAEVAVLCEAVQAKCTTATTTTSTSSSS